MLIGMELDVAPDLLHRRQPAADAACCLAPAGESTAAQTKPARAGVRCRASAELAEWPLGLMVAVLAANISEWQAWRYGPFATTNEDSG